MMAFTDMKFHHKHSWILIHEDDLLGCRCNYKNSLNDEETHVILNQSRLKSNIFNHCRRTVLYFKKTTYHYIFFNSSISFFKSSILSPYPSNLFSNSLIFCSSLLSWGLISCLLCLMTNVNNNIPITEANNIIG